MKKNFILSIFTLIFSFLLIFSTSFSVFADETEEIEGERIYVSLGDSISEGYAINLTTKSDSEELYKGSSNDYSFKEGSYTSNIKKYLEKNYNYKKSYDFSQSGDNCQDLVDFISSFYNEEKNECKNPYLTNSKFSTLTNLQIYNILSNARTITVSIGANNILKDAEKLISRYLGFSSPDITFEQIETALKNDIMGGGTIGGFQSELRDLLSVLNSLNPNAEIYFNEIYNPYAVLDLSSDVANNISTINLFYPHFTQARLNDISSLVELAVNGGIDSNSNIFRGLNQVLSIEIDRINEIEKSNFYLIESKGKFDNIYRVSKNNYKIYVNTRLSDLGFEQAYTMGSDPDKIFENYLDPHPTYSGHTLIFEAHKSASIGSRYKTELKSYETIIVISGIIAFVVILILSVVIAIRKTKNKIC